MSRKKPEANGDAVEPPLPVDDPAPEGEKPNMPCFVARYSLIRACVWANPSEMSCP